MGYVVLDSRLYRNGQHTIKAITVDANSLITVSENATVNFDNELNCVTSSERFKRGEDYHVYGLNLSAENIRIKLKDWEDNIIWMSSGRSADVNFVIPSEVLNGQIYDVVIEKSGESWEQIWERAIGKEYEPNSFYKFAIFLPTAWTYFPWPANAADCRKRTVAEIVKACETKHMNYVVLYKGQCTWKNFASVLSQPSVSYAYLVSHGGSHIGILKPVQRTYFYLTDSVVLSYYNDKLPEGIKKRKDVYYMSSLGLGTIDKMRIVHTDICSIAEYRDMAARWIIDVEDNVNQLFIGWNARIGMKDDDYDIWSSDIWHALGNEDNYENAEDYALKDPNNNKPYAIYGKSQYYGFYQITFTSEGN